MPSCDFSDLRNQIRLKCVDSGRTALGHIARLHADFLWACHALLVWPSGRSTRPIHLVAQSQPRSQGISSSRQKRLKRDFWREEERPWERGWPRARLFQEKVRKIDCVACSRPRSNLLPWAQRFSFFSFSIDSEPQRRWQREEDKIWKKISGTRVPTS